MHTNQDHSTSYKEAPKSCPCRQTQVYGNSLAKLIIQICSHQADTQVFSYKPLPHPTNLKCTGLVFRMPLNFLTFHGLGWNFGISLSLLLLFDKNLGARFGHLLPDPMWPDKLILLFRSGLLVSHPLDLAI